jgi:hypothetical protein
MNPAKDLARAVFWSAPAPSAKEKPNEEITMQSTVRIFKLDEIKKGIAKKTGNPYEIHTAQAALIDASGNVDQVGVLDIPPDLRNKGIGPGDYSGTFAMKTNFQSGRIEAALVGLTALKGAVPVSERKGA